MNDYRITKLVYGVMTGIATLVAAGIWIWILVTMLQIVGR